MLLAGMDCIQCPALRGHKAVEMPLPLIYEALQPEVPRQYGHRPHDPFTRRLLCPGPLSAGERFAPMALALSAGLGGKHVQR